MLQIIKKAKEKILKEENVVKIFLNPSIVKYF